MEGGTKFPAVKSLDSLRLRRHSVAQTRTLVLELARSEYVTRRENIIAVGNSGTGKTHIGLGLGLAACQKGGLSVGFNIAAALVHELLEAREREAVASSRRLQSAARRRAVNEKHIKEYSIPNVTAVIMTTNHKTDGLCLPAHDRAYVAGTSSLIIDELGYVPLSTAVELLPPGWPLSTCQFRFKAPPKKPKRLDIISAHSPLRTMSGGWSPAGTHILTITDLIREAQACVPTRRMADGSQEPQGHAPAEERLRGRDRPAPSCCSEVFSQRYERGSTVVTSNLPFDEWTSVLQALRRDRCNRRDFYCAMFRDKNRKILHK